MQMIIWRMMEATEVKKTMRMDLFAYPYFLEKKVSVQVFTTRGAVDATPLNPTRLSTMVRTAASSKVEKLKTVCAISLVLSRLESACTFISSIMQ